MQTTGFLHQSDRKKASRAVRSKRVRMGVELLMHYPPKADALRPLREALFETAARPCLFRASNRSGVQTSGLLVYCLLLPIGLSTSIGWLTTLVAPFIAYTFLALDVIGEQIEEPFGKEPNDLALASMCHGIEMSVCELVGETPRSTPPAVVNYVVS